MANVISRSQVDNFLDALWKDEQEIMEAGQAYEAAKARLDVSLRRYIALRDYVTEQIGQSPYAHRIGLWPSDDPHDEAWTIRGRYRFTGMKVGDAIIQVLKERAEGDGRPKWHPTMSLDELTEVLSEGGLGFPEPIQARAVNAALMKTTGIYRSHYSNNYYYNEEGEDDPDAPRSIFTVDGPFE